MPVPGSPLMGLSRQVETPCDVCEGKGFDEAVFGNDAAFASAKNAVEFAAQRLEIFDLALDLDQVLARDHLDRPTGSVTLIGEPKKVTHPINRKAEIARSANEAEAAKMRLRIAPGAGKSPILS